MPVAQDAEPATDSLQLRMGRALLGGENKYAFDRALKMTEAGSVEQAGYSEKAAERRQRTKDMGYEAGLNRYGASSAMRQQAGWNRRAAVQDNNYKVADREDTQNFTAGQNALSRDFEARENQLNRDAQWRTANAQIEASRATREEKAQARQDAFFSTAVGQKASTAANDALTAATDLISKLDEFENLQKTTRTGPARRLPVLGTMFNADAQKMDAISQDLSILKSGILKGAISDKEGERILRSLPSTGNFPSANRGIMKVIRGAVNRVVEMQTNRMSVMGKPEEREFNEQWSAFVSSTPADSGITFQQWKMRLPRVK